MRRDLFKAVEIMITVVRGFLKTKGTIPSPPNSAVLGSATRLYKTSDFRDIGATAPDQ